MVATTKKRRRPRPRVFVGSSTESLDVAYAIQENLQHDAEVTVWPQGIFEPSQTVLRSLIQVLDNSDFGVFVFTPDDRLRFRKRTQSAVRDNVVFELGLFAGKLGSERTFIVVPDGVTDLRIPTDLTGVTPGNYDSSRRDKNMQAALGPFCNQVRRALKRRGAIRQHRTSQKRHGKRKRLSDVIIHSALYGIPFHWINVREALVRELKTRGFARAGNQLGGDPEHGVVKTLKLDFTYRGERRKIEIPEGSVITFPG